MLTSYEIGRVTGQLRAPLDAEISITMAEGIAHDLGMEGDRFTEFLEGYRNGYTEAKKTDQADMRNWERCSDCGFSWPPSVLDCHKCNGNAERTERWQRKLEAERATQEQEWIPSAAELDAIEESLDPNTDHTYANRMLMTDEERIAGYEEHGIGYCPNCLSPDCYNGCEESLDEEEGHKTYREIEESLEAGRQMARDESGAIQSQRF